MAGDTRTRILETALELFARSGYLGTSMQDIAKRLGVTKAALYKHYASKQEILDQIVKRMHEMDLARAKAFEMPETETEGFAETYLRMSAEKIRAYSAAQFRHWTEDRFSADFRKMLTLEQYRDPALAQLYQSCLAEGPVRYMTAIFREMTDSDETARQLALDFYGPVFLLYGVYDGAADKKAVTAMLDAHVERFIARLEAARAEAGERT